MGKIKTLKDLRELVDSLKEYADEMNIDFNESTHTQSIVSIINNVKVSESENCIEIECRVE